MIKNDSLEGGKLSGHAMQVITSINIFLPELINLSFDFSGNKKAYPTPDQTFLYDIWITLESIQDKITNQDSKKYQLLEIINPILFESWISTGGM